MILENIHRLSKTQIPIVIRIPIIPGINDSEDDMRAFEDYVYWVLKSRLYSWFRNIYVVIHHKFEQGREMPMTLWGRTAAKRATMEYFEETLGEGWWGAKAMRTTTRN